MAPQSASTQNQCGKVVKTKDTDRTRLVPLRVNQENLNSQSTASTNSCTSNRQEKEMSNNQPRSQWHSANGSSAAAKSKTDENRISYQKTTGNQNKNPTNEAQQSSSAQSSNTKACNQPSGDWNPFLKKAARIIDPIWEQLAIKLEFTSADCSEFKAKPIPGVPWWPAFRMLLAWKDKILLDTRVNTDSSVLAQLKHILLDSMRPLDHHIAEQFSRDLWRQTASDLFCRTM